MQGKQALSVVVPAGNHENAFPIHSVNEAMHLIDAPGPVSLQVEFERFRFSDAFVGFLRDTLAKLPDAFHFLRMFLLPVSEILLRRQSKPHTHKCSEVNVQDLSFGSFVE